MARFIVFSSAPCWCLQCPITLPNMLCDTAASAVISTCLHGPVALYVVSALCLAAGSYNWAAIAVSYLSLLVFCCRWIFNIVSLPPTVRITLIEKLADIEHRLAYG